jgi:hypothetical protein
VWVGGSVVKDFTCNIATSNMGAKGCVWNKGMASKISILALLSPALSFFFLLSAVLPTRIPHTEENAYLYAWRIALIYAVDDI